MVQDCSVLLLHQSRGAFLPAPYLDSHGESDTGLKRGRPLFLSEARYQALVALWRNHGVVSEVVRFVRALGGRRIEWDSM